MNNKIWNWIVGATGAGLLSLCTGLAGYGMSQHTVKEETSAQLTAIAEKMTTELASVKITQNGLQKDVLFLQSADQAIRADQTVDRSETSKRIFEVVGLIKSQNDLMGKMVDQNRELLSELRAAKLYKP